MKKLNNKNKCCVYLDQFVISDIIEAKNPLWIEIKNLLELNYNKGLIYCPLSAEHFLETIRKNIVDARIHNDYFREISDGYILKSEPFLTAQIISSLIRENSKTLNTFLTQASLKDIEKFYNDLNIHHDKYRTGMGSLLSDQNSLRKILYSKSDKKTEVQFINVIKQLEVEKFKNRLIEYLNNKLIVIRPDSFGDSQIPNWIDQLLFQLTYKHQFKERELKLFLSELQVHGFNRIPTLNTKFSIQGYLAVKSKQENSGDHIDIMRISTYLFSTDIFFTDKKRKYEICELGLDKKYNTVVLSGVENDLCQFIEILKAM